MPFHSSPRVPIRTVNECFYGERWVPEDRLAVLRHAAAFGANAYVYGPSADRRTGGLWQAEYEGSERGVLTEFAAECRALGVEPIWRVSPSAPLEPERGIRFTDPTDREALISKVRHILDLGFTRILIAFDDLTHGLDSESALLFAETGHPLAAAHASAVRAVGDAVGYDRLIVCPLHYWGATPSPYRQAFGAALPASVPIIWTGPAVISTEITAEQARSVAAELGHPLWLWDNYPVNDWDMDGITADTLHGIDGGLDNLVTPRRLPLAPLLGRDPDLVDELQGMGGNLTLDPWSGIPAMLSLLAFAWQGPAYDPELAWRAAAEQIDVDPDALTLLRDASGPGSGAPIGAAATLAQACARVFTEDDRAASLKDLDRVVDEHIAAIVALRARPSRFTWELRPWLLELGRQCHLASLASSALRASEEERSDLVAALRGALLRPSTVSVASGMGRTLAEYARGVIAGGIPAIELPTLTTNR